MTAGEKSGVAWSTTCTAADLAVLREARDRGVAWLSDRVGDDGAPEGADLGNSWWRAPWALAVGGAPDVAVAMMSWIERHALTDGGALRPGPYDAPASTSPVYHLSPLAIAASLLERYDTADAVMDGMLPYVDPTSGGVFEHRPHDQDPLQDTLKTAQFGVSALLTRRTDLAEAVYGWLSTNFAEQPELPAKLYTSRRHGALVTEFPESERSARVVDFAARQQFYFHPGISAAFLSGYYRQTGDEAALALARSYLALNQAGTDEQFDDPTSVQICKFGWGAAVTYTVDPDPALRPWVVRSGEWFRRRQEANGSWAPASFMAPNPGLLDYYWKTAEHVMELSYIVSALSAEPLD